MSRAHSLQLPHCVYGYSIVLHVRTVTVLGKICFPLAVMSYSAIRWPTFKRVSKPVAGARPGPEDASSISLPDSDEEIGLQSGFPFAGRVVCKLATLGTRRPLPGLRGPILGSRSPSCEDCVSSASEQPICGTRTAKNESSRWASKGVRPLPRYATTLWPC